MHPLQRLLPEWISSHLTPLRRDLLVFLLAVVLLLSPVLVATGYVGADNNQYGSTQVVTSGETLVYTDGSAVPPGTPISEDIACTGTQVQRACAIEPLVGEQTLPLGVRSESPDFDPAIAEQPYRFVQLEDGLYRAVYRVDTDDNVGVGLSPSSPSVALNSVSVDPAESDVPSTVVEAAEEGEATSRNAVDVPQTPVNVDGDYYRVYLADESPEGSNSPFSLAIFFGAGLGGVLLLSLARNLRVSYTPR